VSSLSELPTIEIVWAALSNCVRPHPAMMECLKRSSRGFTAATYKNHFGEPHSMERAGLMFWQRIFVS